MSKQKLYFLDEKTYLQVRHDLIGDDNPDLSLPNDCLDGPPEKMYCSKFTTKESEAWNVHYYLLEVPFTLHGDYVGSTVERSNYEVLLAKYPHYFVQVAWWYSQGLYTFDPDNEHIKLPSDYKEDIEDVLCKLGRYPVYDDGALSTLEQTLLREFVEGDGLLDLRNALLKAGYDQSIIDAIKKSQLIALWWELLEGDLYNYIVYESPYSPYISDDALYNAIVAAKDSSLLLRRITHTDVWQNTPYTKQQAAQTALPMFFV